MKMRWRRFEQNIFYIICVCAALFASLMLFFIIGDIFLNALPSLSRYFITTPESATPYIGQAIGNAIVGTILISVISTLLATPVAVGTAIYLQRYAREGRAVKVFRYLIEVLSGTPSIVLGIFGLLMISMYLGPLTGGFSLISGSIALSILILPVIERAAEDAILRVDNLHEEGSYALGATKWETIKLITLPSAASGILTGIILGFGRAAEESAVVILTAGYSQFMPEFAVKANEKLIGGIKIYPLQDVVGTLPYAVYHAYENSNVVKLSNGFAAAFILICIVLVINISAKVIAHRYLSAQSGEKPWTETFCTMLARLKTAILGGRENLRPGSPGKSTGTPPPPSTRDSDPLKQTDQDPVLLPPVTFDKEEQEPKEGRTTSKCSQETSSNPPRSSRQRIALAGISIRHWIAGLRLPSAGPVSSPCKGQLPAREKEKKQELRESLGAFGKTFFLTIIPFTIIAGILAILSFVVPKFGTGISFRPGGFSAVLIFTLILGGICSLVALFMLRGSLLFLIHKKKNRLLGSRNGAYFAVGVGICLVIAGAFLFSTHAFQLADTANGGEESGLFGFLKDQFALSGLGNGQNTTTQQPMNRTEQLEALPAAEGDSSASMTPAADTTPVVVPITTVPVPSAGAAFTPSVPLKNALSLRESYQYGNTNRRCTATVYNQMVLPFYFWWLIDYNRFVQVTPGPGNKTLVVFLRIENTGNNSAIVPSADEVVITYKGTTYTHQPYFNTSYLSDWQIDYYSTHLDALPYQWIRELGANKRDYAYLTGYNIFGQNLTRLDSTSDVPNPGFDINGKGFFIQPGSSNAIDGYLIYNVPDSVAADLKNAYVQISFNSISSTRWRLGT
jgi:phosphate transport system permease protein